MSACPQEERAEQAETAAKTLRNERTALREKARREGGREKGRNALHVYRLRAVGRHFCSRSRDPGTAHAAGAMRGGKMTPVPLSLQVEELEARLAPAAADAARKAEGRVTEAERRADVAERQLAAVKAEREELRRKLNEVASGGLAVVSTEPAARNGALTQVRDELLAVQAEVASVIDKLKDREKVLSKVLARSHVGEMSKLSRP